jgi:hypothetical protein
LLTICFSGTEGKNGVCVARDLAKLTQSNVTGPVARCKRTENLKNVYKTKSIFTDEETTHGKPTYQNEYTIQTPKGILPSDPPVTYGPNGQVVK